VTAASHLEVLALHVDLAAASVVDVGFGRGELMRAIRGCGARVRGVECGQPARAAAIAADPSHAEDYLDGVGQALPFADGEVDVVIYSYSLHHVPAASMTAAVSEAHRVLRPSGTLYVLEPVAAGPEHDLAAMIDDETEVRALAQAALDEITGFEERARVDYETVNRYVDWDQWESVMVGVDAARASIMDRVRDRARPQFEATADRGADGSFQFVEQNLLRVFDRT